MLDRVNAFLSNFDKDIRVTIYNEKNRMNPISEGNFKQDTFIRELWKENFELVGFGTNEIYIRIHSKNSAKDFVIQILDFDFDHELHFS